MSPYRARNVKRYVLASDPGSGSCKTMLLDENARIAGQASREYPTYHPEPGWVEQNPEDWYGSFTETVRVVLSVSGIDPAYKEYRLIGGGAKSPHWRRIVCDVLGPPVTVPRERDAVYGAALGPIASELRSFEAEHPGVSG